ncbi:prepilin-type N-terminal cleavage/methylation domain-containing protein [Candidatus Saccharibacteria bacterium]|nr:prepilin-type N-terminal cleavage/methylation domain-containing protein [Candidatus Saccharibacteria bacterium]
MRVQDQKGFTLIELMIASSVFAVVLLGAAAALVQVSRLYYKGLISSQTQGVARTTIDEVSRAIQFSGEEVVNVGPEVKGMSPNTIEVRAVCVGTNRYTYAVNAQVNDAATTYTGSSAGRNIPHALWKDTVTSPSECDPDPDSDSQDDLPDLTSNSLSNGRELLEQNMRLKSFVVNSVANNLYGVSIGIIYGADELLLPDASNPASCVGSVVGGQWCAVSELSTQVFKRIQ